MAAQSDPRFNIASQVLPGTRFAFAEGIDLMDETLREGAERATMPPSMEDKVALAEAITHAGIRTLVVGMFPDVPHNVTLLAELVKRQQAGRIPADVRFMIISHVGVTFEQTLQTLAEHKIPTQSVWIIVIHSVSDQQLRHLFPTILKKDASLAWDDAAWQARTIEQVRAENLRWLDDFLPSTKRYEGGGLMLGFLDAFRADHNHLMNACRVAARHNMPQVRLVDTAGTCLPHQIPKTVGELIQEFPQIAFFGHFHDDFGMATANALAGLSLGLKGVDVSVGGFANRAGHPPLAEVAMALRQLYGIELPGFRYDQLFALSRLSERLYGLMENAAQAVTGVITHSVQSGIRTELLRKAPTIFDILDPQDIGSSLVRMFGVRSGRDGLLRFLKESDLLTRWDMAPTAELADTLYPKLETEWRTRSERTLSQLRECIGTYQQLLQDSFFTEDDVGQWLQAHIEMFKTTEGNTQ